MISYRSYNSDIPHGMSTKDRSAVRSARSIHFGEFLLDLGIAAACYVMAYRVRFAAPQF